MDAYDWNRIQKKRYKSAVKEEKRRQRALLSLRARPREGISAWIAFNAWLVGATTFEFVSSYMVVGIIWTVLTSGWLWFIGFGFATWLWGKALTWR